MIRILGSTLLAVGLLTVRVPLANAEEQATLPTPAEAAPPSSSSTLQPTPMPAAGNAATPAAATAAPAPTTTVPAAPTPSVNASQQAVPAPLVFADDGSEPTTWYGWQILTTDATAVTLFAVAAVDPQNEETWLALGTATAFLGGPIVHAAHGNWGRAAGSLGLRLGAPSLLALIGGSLEECGSSSNELCGFGGAATGFALGAVTAIAIDVALFAYDDDEPPPSVMPVANLDENGGLIGVAGRF